VRISYPPSTSPPDAGLRGPLTMRPNPTLGASCRATSRRSSCWCSPPCSSAPRWISDDGLIPSDGDERHPRLRADVNVASGADVHPPLWLALLRPAIRRGTSTTPPRAVDRRVPVGCSGWPCRGEDDVAGVGGRGRLLSSRAFTDTRRPAREPLVNLLLAAFVGVCLARTGSQPADSARCGMARWCPARPDTVLLVAPLLIRQRSSPRRRAAARSVSLACCRPRRGRRSPWSTTASLPEHRLRQAGHGHQQAQLWKQGVIYVIDVFRPWTRSHPC